MFAVENFNGLIEIRIFIHIMFEFKLQCSVKKSNSKISKQSLCSTALKLFWRLFTKKYRLHLQKKASGKTFMTSPTQYSRYKSCSNVIRIASSDLKYMHHSPFSSCILMKFCAPSAVCALWDASFLENGNQSLLLKLKHSSLLLLLTAFPRLFSRF